MRLVPATTVVRPVSPVACAVTAALSIAAAAPAWAQQGLEEVVVTAQRRESALQTTPIAITAFGGQQIAEDKIFSVSELADSAPSFSFTAGSPLDAELNIRGITNTRLDSPTSDPSVGTFVDGVYVGRTGDYNFDFYDLERVEVIRGPQGVLLGKNVVGGAISVITNAPSQENAAELTLSYGNYDSQLISGFVNGGLSDTVAGRFSLQYRSHDGYAEDILHDRETQDLSSMQARGQLQFESPESGWRVRGILDYSDDSSNGLNVVAVKGGIKNCEQTYLRSNCSRPWSNLREYLGINDPWKNVASSVNFAGTTTQTQQFLDREGWGLTLDIQKTNDAFDFNSLTGYRQVDTKQLYDQTGAGPEALDWNTQQWAAYRAWIDAKYGPRPASSNNGLFLFSQPVNEDWEGDSFSQEFRLTSRDTGSRWDWIAGAFYKQDNGDKTDRFVGENFLGTIFPGGNNPLSTLSGQSQWHNDGEMINYAFFGQVGFRFTDSVKLSAGVRWTSDEKKGTVTALVAESGDRFSPNDPRANVTIESLCRRPDGTVVSPTPATCAAPNKWTYGEGEGFTAHYDEKWTKVTPQVTLDWKINEDVFTYLTYSEGFKGGGFDDTPANPAQATTPFDPEEATNYELGVKTTLLDRRIRFNADVFYMDYTDLQVTQTNAACLCNLTDNAASADIWGLEGEFTWRVIDDLLVSLSGSYVDPEYKDFLESAIDPTTGKNLDSSGNRLQRTPTTQFAGMIDYQMPIANWGNALKMRLSYTWQSDMYWATDNVAREGSYGLLDARVALAPDDQPWTLAVWGKNLTDTLYRTNIIPFFGEEVSQFGAPLTFGLDLTWKF